MPTGDMFASRVTKLCLVATALWLSYVALLPPAPSYEISLLEVVHPAARAVFIVVLLTSALVVVQAAITEVRSRFWLASAGCSIAAYVGYFALPLAREYVVYGRFSYDVLVHLGLIDDILETGALSDLLYPATHLLSVAATFLAGMQPESTVALLGFWFKVILIGGLVLLVRSQSGEQSLALLTFVAALPIFFTSNRFSLAPWLFGLTLLPFVVYVVHRFASDNVQRTAYPFSVLAVGLILYHPISAFYAFTAAAVLLVIIGLTDRSTTRTTRATLPDLRGVGLVCSGFAGLLGWHVHHETVDGNVRSSILSLLTMEAGGGTETATRATEVNYTLEQLLFTFVIPNWGVLMLYFGLAGLATLAIGYRLLRRQATLFENHVAVQTIFGGILAIAFLGIQLYGSSIIRAAQYLILFAIPAVAIGCWYLSEMRHRRVIASIVLVIVLASIGGAIVYSTSTAYSENTHLTAASSTGYSWHLETKDRSEPTYTDMSRDVFAYYEYGYDEADELIRSDEYVTATPHLSPHLGYHETPTVRSWLPTDGYVVIRTEDLVWHEAEPEWRHDDLVRITGEDYDTLAQDRTANRIYSNGEVRIWQTRH
ncbi:hypothetical protein [Natronolimnobius sp. AArcel1]|uniref:hypothetical protein n=1 Tax=Natronolimnobius sp. AArcel1 TaxID=1679093 RepID=UPI0013EBC1BE|nr:hypothetical protein [Natronolimnobius sp. AArcel1]